MKSICGAECDNCELFNKQCSGCQKTKGCPFGKKCWIAKYMEIGGKEQFQIMKDKIIEEFNSLKIEGLPMIKELYPLKGSFVNLEYPLPNGTKTKLLQDNETYLGNQIECEFNDDEIKKCFGLLANMNFILVCEYEENGNHPEIVLFKRR